MLDAASAERIRAAAEDTRRGGVLAAEMAKAAPVGRAGDGPRASEAARYPDAPEWNALREVMDPELPVSVVDLGLIVDVEREGGRVTVDLTYTAIGCPCSAFIREDVRDRLLREPGVDSVEIREVWQPAWTRARMTAVARDALRRCGVA